MSRLEIIDVEQGTPEWLTARAGLLTASTMKNLVTNTGNLTRNRKGDGPSDAAVRFMDDLSTQRITGWVEPVYANRDMERGNWDEPIARQEYERLTGQTVEQVGLIVRTFDNGTRLGWSPDGLVGTDGAIEIKSRKQTLQKQTLQSDTVPPEFMAQLQTALYVSGRAWIDFVSYSGGMPLYVKRVEPDAKWFESIREAHATFERYADQDAAAYVRTTKGLTNTVRPAHYYPDNL